MNLIGSLAWLLSAVAVSLVHAEESSNVQKKTSNIIPSAGEADLYNGIGDLLAAGACSAEIKLFCKETVAGEGRIAACLANREKAKKQGNAVGKGLGEKCMKALADYRVDRSKNINKDIPLARACKDDAKKLCGDVSDAKNPGSVIVCLRDKKAKVSAAGCKAEIFRTLQEASADYRTDYQLYEACKEDAGNLCTDVDPGDGREVECLTEKRIQVSWPCQSQIFRNQKETGDDIRLSARLFGKCVGDFQRFCKDVEPGNMRVQECLEDNIEEGDFSAGCKEELEALLAKRVQDFRLDAALRDACEEDLKSICGATLDDMDKDDRTKRTALTCLQQYKEEIRVERCAAEVHRRMQRAGRDIRFDEVLADACFEDRAKFCTDLQPGSARVIRCLQENLDQLDQKCAAALFDHEVRMAEDIDFKYPMKKACRYEMATLCKDTQHGHARIVRCLEDQLEHEDMSVECKAEVMKDMNRQATDHRLNWRLNTACQEDIGKLCSNACSSTPGQTCGGLVLQCLQDKQDNISSQACQDEVFYYELMEVSDFRNDVILAEACRADVEMYCKDTEPGNGRVHSCLRFNRDKISERCAKEELKLQAVEARDIRLRPKLNQACSEEKAVFCSEVKPGKARVIKCLMENMAQPNFGEECREELQKREDVMKSDYRFDVGVATNCAVDVETHCKDAKAKLRGNAAVLKCLAENFAVLEEQCQDEMSRAVRLALWDYKPGAGLTAACDANVDEMCPRGARSKSGGLFTIGVVGRCLSKALVEGKRLDGKCRSLVLVAAPRDARAYFEYPQSTSALVLKIADMQKAAGMEGALVDPYARGGSSVTVTGWMALVCMLSLAVVIVGGAILAYRRAVGIDKPHTIEVKMGDA